MWESEIKSTDFFFFYSTPVMVAIALIESGTNALDAVAMIRKQRKGAVNKPQLEFLQKYKKRSKKKGCIVM